MIDLIDLERPSSVKDVLRIRDKIRPTILLAGGTDLLVYAKDRKIPPAVWIDLTGIASLRRIHIKNGILRIGALTTWKQGDESQDFLHHAGALRDACRVFASPPIRGLGTFAGNVANASPAGDGIPPLVALGAKVVLRSWDGIRRVPVEDFILGVRKTLLKEDELITEIRVPVEPDLRSVFLKLGPRQALAISKLSVAVAARMTRGKAQQVRIALGAVAPTVVRARAAEAVLEGSSLSPGDIATAARLALEAAAPIDDVRSTARYRYAVVAIGVKRALQSLREGEQGGDLVLKSPTM